MLPQKQKSFCTGRLRSASGIFPRLIRAASRQCSLRIGASRLLAPRTLLQHLILQPRHRSRRGLSRLLSRRAVASGPFSRVSLRRESFPITALRLTPISSAISRQASPAAKPRFMSSSVSVRLNGRACDDPGLRGVRSGWLASQSSNRRARRSLRALAVVADRQQPVLDGKPDAFLDQGPCDAGNAGAVGALSHQLFEIADGGERQRNRNAVGFGFFCGHAKTLAFNGCTEKYLFKLYFIIGLIARSESRCTPVVGAQGADCQNWGIGVPTGMAPNPNLAPILFDRALLRARQARALRAGPATFLLDRVAEDLGGTAARGAAGIR